ncbi:DNA mismatch repair protein mutS, partial [Entamoeba invadens IP1]
MSDFNLSQDIDGFLLSNTTPQNAKSFNVLTVNSPFTSPTLRKQKLGTSDIFDSSNAPTPKQTFTTDFTKGQFTSPLISSGMPTPASALEKTPLLSKLLLNSKPRPVPAQLSPALLCKDVSKSQLRFSQDPSIDSSQNDEVEVTDKKPLISAQLRLPNKPNEFEQPEPPSTFRVLSLSTTNNRLGIATLDIDEGKLELSSMFLDPAECSTLDCYLFQSSASVVITHSKIPPNVLAHLKSKDIELEILPSADFSVDSCVQNFKAIPLGFVKNQQDERSLFISLASYISFEENNELTKAVGGVLAYFRNYIAAQPDELRRNYSIKDISTLQWDRTLLINEQSFSALYIFKKEQHPDVHSKGGSKEGLSLFGCLNKCI